RIPALGAALAATRWTNSWPLNLASAEFQRWWPPRPYSRMSDRVELGTEDARSCDFGTFATVRARGAVLRRQLAPKSEQCIVGSLYRGGTAQHRSAWQARGRRRTCRREHLSFSAQTVVAPA